MNYWWRLILFYNINGLLGHFLYPYHPWLDAHNQAEVSMHLQQKIVRHFYKQ